MRRIRAGEEFLESLGVGLEMFSREERSMARRDDAERYVCNFFKGFLPASSASGIEKRCRKSYQVADEEDSGTWIEHPHITCCHCVFSHMDLQLMVANRENF